MKIRDQRNIRGSPDCSLHLTASKGLVQPRKLGNARLRSASVNNGQSGEKYRAHVLKHIT